MLSQPQWLRQIEFLGSFSATTMRGSANGRMSLILSSLRLSMFYRRTEGGGKKSPPPPHVSAIAKTSKLGINYMLL